MVSRSSQAILSREYCQYGLRSGVDSVIGRREGGVWYAEAELMKTYWPTRPRKRSVRARTCSGVNASQSTTASKSSPRTASANAAESLTSAVRRCASGGRGRTDVEPRFATVRSMPCSTARREQAELIDARAAEEEDPWRGHGWRPGRRRCPVDLVLRLRQQLDDAHPEAEVELVRHSTGGALHQLLRGRREEGSEGVVVGAWRHRREPRSPHSAASYVAGGGRRELRQRDGAGLPGLVVGDEVDLVPRPGTAVSEPMGPRVAMSVENACGPVSQRAPASCRHGEAPNGLPGSWRALNHRTHPPCQPAVRRTSSIHSRVSSTNRSVKKTTDDTPASIAAVSSRALRRVGIGGHRLVEEEVLPGAGGLQCHLGLDGWGHRERHGVDVGQQRRVVVVGRDAERLGEGLRPTGRASPDAHQLNPFGCHQPGAVRHLRPWAGPY